MSSIASPSISNNMSADKTKKSAKKVVAEPVAAPATATATEKKPRVVKKAATPAKVETVVPTLVSEVVAPAVVEPAQDRLTNVVEKLKATQSRFSAELKEIAKEALSAVKAASREIKDAKKRKRSKRPEDMTPEEKKAWEARRANNAFLKPRGLSPELCSFMGLAPGSLRSQTEVTKFVSTYVREHNCFDPANKRRILPDAVMAKLLKVTDKDVVTYLNLQSYLKGHFLKTVVAA